MLQDLPTLPSYTYRKTGSEEGEPDESGAGTQLVKRQPVELVGQEVDYTQPLHMFLDIPLY